MALITHATTKMTAKISPNIFLIISLFLLNHLITYSVSFRYIWLYLVKFYNENRDNNGTDKTGRGESRSFKIVPLISLRACYIIHESNEITSFLSYLPTVAFIASFYSFYSCTARQRCRANLFRGQNKRLRYGSLLLI